MPVVMRFGRFKFVIYPKDHRPSHVHVFAAGAEAKFDIQTGECLKVYGFERGTVKILKDVILQNQDLLMGAWEEYEGQE